MMMHLGFVFMLLEQLAHSDNTALIPVKLNMRRSEMRVDNVRDVFRRKAQSRQVLQFVFASLRLCVEITP